MGPAEVTLTLAVVVVPPLLGFVAALMSRPWWWAALAAVAIFVLAAVAPTPEPGQTRVAAGDLGFLTVVAVIITGLAWLGALIGRLVVRRSSRSARPH